MDTSQAALTRSVEKIAVSFAAFKEANDERIAALEEGKGSAAAELDEKVGRIEKSITEATKAKKTIETELQIQRDRLEELEAKAGQPGRTAAEARQSEYKQTFLDWVRFKGNSPMHEQQLQDQAKTMMEKKDVTIGVGSGGGFAVPEEIAREIERQELLFSPVRRLVKVVRAGSSDHKELVNLRGATSGWVGESGPRTATGTPQLREVAPTFGELYAYPQVSEWSLDDIYFNVEAWLAEEAAEEFALREGEAVITGDGVSKPTGMLNTTPTADPDFASPLRAAAAYEFVACPSSVSPAVAEILPDCLIDLTYKLRAPYRAQATWVMNSITAGSIRKLKTVDGQYLWQPSLQSGEPDRLLGFEHETWEQMQDIGINNFPVAFGNFRRGYVLTDRVGLRITRDSVTNVGFVKFYIRRREGGIVLNNDAIKFLRTT